MAGIRDVEIVARVMHKANSCGIHPNNIQPAWESLRPITKNMYRDMANAVLDFLSCGKASETVPEKEQDPVKPLVDSCITGGTTAGKPPYIHDREPEQKPQPETEAHYQERLLKALRSFS